MTLQPVRSFVCWCAVLIAGLPGLWEPGALHAEDNPAAKKRRNPQQLEKRIERLERRLLQLRGEQDQTDAAPKKSESSSNGRRYQMMRVGERLVILDSETGETRIIESDSGQPIQNVQVGKALVVVTVLGRVLTPTPSQGDPLPKNKQP